MKKLLLTLFILLSMVATVTISSCHKYPNDPHISWETSKKRLCRTWVWDYSNQISYTFKADGSLTRAYYGGTTPHTWSLTHDHKLIIDTNPPRVINELTDNVFDCSIDSGVDTKYHSQ